MRNLIFSQYAWEWKTKYISPMLLNSRNNFGISLLKIDVILINVNIKIWVELFGSGAYSYKNKCASFHFVFLLILSLEVSPTLFVFGADESFLDWSANLNSRNRDTIEFTHKTSAMVPTLAYMLSGKLNRSKNWIENVCQAQQHIDNWSCWGEQCSGP